MNTFTRTVRDAVKFFLRNGYSSREELERWQAIIRQAAERETADDYMAMVTRNLTKAYDLQVGRAEAPSGHIPVYAQLPRAKTEDRARQADPRQRRSYPAQPQESYRHYPVAV